MRSVISVQGNVCFQASFTEWMVSSYKCLTELQLLSPDHLDIQVLSLFFSFMMRGYPLAIFPDRINLLRDAYPNTQTHVALPNIRSWGRSKLKYCANLATPWWACEIQKFKPLKLLFLAGSDLQILRYLGHLHAQGQLRGQHWRICTSHPL